MAAPIANACLSAYYHLYRISRIRHTLTTCTTKCLVQALVTSRIDYDNAMMYGIPDHLLDRLELIQHSAAKVVLRIRRGDRRIMTAALEHPHWLPVKWRVEYKLLVLVFRALRDRTSTYLASLLTPYVPRPSRPDVDVPGLAAHAICAAPFVTGRRRTWPRCSRHMCRALRDRTSTYLASLLTPYVPRPSRPDVDVPGLAAHAICAAPFVTGRRRTWPRCSRLMCRALPDQTPA